MIRHEAAKMACARARAYALSQQAGARLDGVNAGRCAGSGLAHGQPQRERIPPFSNVRSRILMAISILHAKAAKYGAKRRCGRGRRLASLIIR